MSNLVFNDIGEHAGKPGLHAFLVGVSHYPSLPDAGDELTPHHQNYALGLSRLTSAASSAFHIYKWLIEYKECLAVPLVTCRLLIAPSQEELESVPEIASFDSSVDLTSFLTTAASWREDSSSHRDNVTLFYFAGHGL